MSEFKLKQTAEEVQKAIDDASIPSDWNQTDSSAADFIKNKPFGEFKGDTLTWEIDLGSLDSDSLVGGAYVKVSDAIVTMGDLVNGTILDLSVLGHGVMEFPPEDSGEEIVDGAIMGPDGLVFYISNSGVGVNIDGMIFPESGVYIICEFINGALTIPGCVGFINRKKLATDYIPDTCTQTVVLYVGYDEASDKNYLYNDVGYTEMVTAEEMAGFIFMKRNILVFEVSNAVATAIHAHPMGIVYATNTYVTTGEPQLCVAYTAY